MTLKSLRLFGFRRVAGIRTIWAMADEEIPDVTTTDELRRRMPDFLEAVRWQKRAIRVRRYTTELAVVVPVDWYERAVAEIGEPGAEPPQPAAE